MRATNFLTISRRKIRFRWCLLLLFEIVVNRFSYRLSQIFDAGVTGDTPTNMFLLNSIIGLCFDKFSINSGRLQCKRYGSIENNIKQSWMKEDGRNGLLLKSNFYEVQIDWTDSLNIKSMKIKIQRLCSLRWFICKIQVIRQYQSTVKTPSVIESRIMSRSWLCILLVCYL